MKHKFLLSTCMLLIAVAISACGAGKDKANIYNDTGRIVQEADSYTFINKVGTQSSNEVFDVKYSSFYGVNTVWTIESKDDGEITFKFNSKVDSGDFKVVLVNPEKKAENILEGTQLGDKTIKLSKGKYTLKIVGKNAKGEINISVSKNQNVNIRSND